MESTSTMNHPQRTSGTTTARRRAIGSLTAAGGSPHSAAMRSSSTSGTERAPDPASVRAARKAALPRLGPAITSPARPSRLVRPEFSPLVTRAISRVNAPHRTSTVHHRAGDRRALEAAQEHAGRWARRALEAGLLDRRADPPSWHEQVDRERLDLARQVGDAVPVQVRRQPVSSAPRPT